MSSHRLTRRVVERLMRVTVIRRWIIKQRRRMRLIGFIFGGVRQRFAPLSKQTRYRVWKVASAAEYSFSLANGSTRPLPDVLVVPPLVYSVGPDSIDFAEGLYRAFSAGQSSGFQRVVASHETSALVLAESLAGLSVHGWRDDGRDHAALRRIALRRPLVLTCGYIANFCVEELRKFGHTVRRVEWFRRGQFGGTDDGHTLIEVQHEGRYVLVDPDMKNVFQDRDGQLLSALDLFLRGFEDTAIVPLATGSLFDVWGAGRWHGAAGFTALHGTEMFPIWYREIMGVLGLWQDSEVLCIGEAVPEESVKQRYAFLDSAEFVERFYSHDRRS